MAEREPIVYGDEWVQQKKLHVERVIKAMRHERVLNRLGMTGFDPSHVECKCSRCKIVE